MKNSSNKHRDTRSAKVLMPTPSIDIQLGKAIASAFEGKALRKTPIWMEKSSINPICSGIVYGKGIPFLIKNHTATVAVTPIVQSESQKSINIDIITENKKFIGVLPRVSKSQKKWNSVKDIAAISEKATKLAAIQVAEVLEVVVLVKDGKLISKKPKGEEVVIRPINRIPVKERRITLKTK